MVRVCILEVSTVELLSGVGWTNDVVVDDDDVVEVVDDVAAGCRVEIDIVVDEGNVGADFSRELLLLLARLLLLVVEELAAPIGALEAVTVIVLGIVWCLVCGVPLVLWPIWILAGVWLGCWIDTKVGVPSTCAKTC